MSDENVEFARTGYAVLNEVYKTGDLDALTTHIANTIDPDCVLVASDVTFQGEWYGREGMVEFIADQMDALDDLWVQPEEYIALDDRLIVPITWGGRAKETQIDVEFASVHVYRMRDGKATRIDMHSDKAAALGAVHAENLRAFWEAWTPDQHIDMSILDPEVTYQDANLPDHIGETYRGHEGVARATQRWLEAYESLTLELERIVGAGDRLVSIHRVRGRARYSGIEAEGPVAYTWTFRDGKVVHFCSYRDPAEALAAAGLQE
jgi:ketosteroid isomerase-like protein